MALTSKGDPAPQLTREQVSALHRDMAKAEPDWVDQSRRLASALDRAISHMPRGASATECQTVVNEYRRDVEDWHRKADEYFRAVGGPIEDLLPLDDEVG